MTYQFEIIPRDWYKRRSPSLPQRKPSQVSIDNFVLEHNHICHMQVQYDDGSQKTLIGRVIYNKLAERWTVDGMELAVNVIVS
ncbi:hypothetical protein ACFSJY_12010 [Thalassotalea euphylliae]|uniref:hypothetical protein n=1 Tax=Thalassotalea euphylliae TaxID=1655234 RepID=UPI0036318589